MRYSVGQVSRLAHVTVRALHHYDDVGLLRPSMRTDAGYRSYSDADLERLQRILCYRELEFSLDDITTILDGDAAGQEGWYEDAGQRFGSRPAWDESRRRAATYGKDEWKRIVAERARNQEAFAAALAAGTPAGGTEAMDLAEEHRRHLDRWFFACDHDMHVRIGDLFVDDPKYAAGYAAAAPGLERYVRDAIRANTARHSNDAQARENDKGPARRPRRAGPPETVSRTPARDRTAGCARSRAATSAASAAPASPGCARGRARCPCAGPPRSSSAARRPAARSGAG